MDNVSLRNCFGFFLVGSARSGQPRRFREVKKESDRVWSKHEKIDPCLVSCAHDDGPVPRIDVEYT